MAEDQVQVEYLEGKRGWGSGNQGESTQSAEALCRRRTTRQIECSPRGKDEMIVCQLCGPVFRVALASIPKNSRASQKEAAGAGKGNSSRPAVGRPAFRGSGKGLQPKDTESVGWQGAGMRAVSSHRSYK